MQTCIHVVIFDNDRLSPHLSIVTSNEDGSNSVTILNVGTAVAEEIIEKHGLKQTDRVPEIPISVYQ